MRRRIPVWVGALVLGWWLAGCPSEDVLNEGGPAPDLLLQYRRDGGIAGLCDELRIGRDLVGTLSSCRGPRRQRALSPTERARLDALVTEYQTFAYRVSDNPQGPDSLTRNIALAGSGRRPRDAAGVAAAIELAEAVAEGPWQ